MLEEVGGLVVDLEWRLIVEGIKIQRRIHNLIVLQTRTRGYGRDAYAERMSAWSELRPPYWEGRDRQIN